MPITDTQRERRKQYIGGSDVAALFGADPFKTAADVVASKIYDLEDDAPSDAMQVGSYLEAGLMNWAEANIGKLTRNQFRSREGSRLGVNIDAILDDNGEPVEGKTAGIVRGHTDEYWGEL